MKLYKLTNGFGDYWVIAEHPTEAELKLKKFLDEADYGIKDKREVKRIELISTGTNDRRFITGHCLLT